ncbi:MAG: hypothetical protein HYZ14_15365 [Bacteroidetes bacterium]|nr:hypothetical protein [Bacteroidota bacterium]
MSERICAQDGYGRLIQPSEIELIAGYDAEAALRDHAYVRECLGTESGDLLVTQYCEFYGLDSEEVLEMLGEEKTDDEEEVILEDEENEILLPSIVELHEILKEEPDFFDDKNDFDRINATQHDARRQNENDNDFLSRNL